MVVLRQQIIDIIIKNNNYKELCRRFNSKYYEDLYQEIFLIILELPEENLPQLKFLSTWYYRVALNTITPTGQLGKVLFRKEVELKEMASVVASGNEVNDEDFIKHAEYYMLNLPEFENRILLLYNELGNMKKVQKHTGISYSALRYVKDKLNK